MTKTRIITVLGITIQTSLMAFNISNSYGSTRVPTPAETVQRNATARLSAGDSHTCQLNYAGTARCWGSNGNGQLGDGTAAERHLPVPVQSLTNAVAISAGSNHTCGLLANGTVRCWGSNSSGELGNNNPGDFSAIPVGVIGLEDAVAITASLHTCALRANGRSRCWGDNVVGQLGDGTTTPRPRPATDVVGFTGATAIAAGGHHTCGLTAANEVSCWGENSSGQLGIGATSNSSVATPVPSGGVSISASAITGDRLHTCAMRASSAVSCWGLNSSGELGDGTNNDRPLPTAVNGLTNAVAIAAGGGAGGHSCALIADGTARCWGVNRAGQLGDGTNNDRPLPTAVVGLINAVAIATGLDHTCALVTITGAARCWGGDFFGQLGNNDDSNRSLPVIVNGLTNTFAIAAGSAHTCAIKATGAVFCWGRNLNGELGVGTTDSSPVAVAVPSFTLNIDPVVELRGKKGEAIVNVIAICEEGDRLQVRVEVTQGSARGHGNDHFECTGITGKFPVSIHPQGNNTFVAGPAQAQAEADIKDQGPVDHQEWSRNVEIVSTP